MWGISWVLIIYFVYRLGLGLELVCFWESIEGGMEEDCRIFYRVCVSLYMDKKRCSGMVFRM